MGSTFDFLRIWFGFCFRFLLRAELFFGKEIVLSYGYGKLEEKWGLTAFVYLDLLDFLGTSFD